MKKLLAPAILLMNRLKIVYKFSLISVLFLLPIVGLGYLLVSQLNASIDDLDRAMTEDADYGFIKVITARGSDKILGATIVGEHAGELITEFILAMKHGLGLNKILGTIHVYPTFSEANKFAAGEWKQAHAPEKILQWLEKFHRWSR